ncbi:MAG: 2-amino-4-ketopentanoate thiolase [Acetobacteraceae bacterium]|nr:2-amino-4-ketopentanoate thiolase [Acetobacteraceae bacterium]
MVEGSVAPGREPAQARPGDWVRIHLVVLEPGQRAPQLPEDTAALPLEARVNGFLQEAAALGQEVEILTLSGRRVRGRLVELNPSPAHGFGRVQPELLSIGPELRRLLEEAGPAAGRKRPPAGRRPWPEVEGK